MSKALEDLVLNVMPLVSYVCPCARLFWVLHAIVEKKSKHCQFFGIVMQIRALIGYM
jgi:hypothetical protein